MYPYKNIIPNNSVSMYRNTPSLQGSNTYGDDRFFLAPFLVGGLAGTALGYGIANNNQLNNNGGCCGYGQVPIMYYPQPYYTNFNSSNSFYY